jgi:hypothetical protein
MGDKMTQVGRPMTLVDFAIVLRLRDVDNLGWSRMAETYRGITGQYISRDTIKRRYLEAKESNFKKDQE